MILISSWKISLFLLHNFTFNSIRLFFATESGSEGCHEIRSTDQGKREEGRLGRGGGEGIVR